MTRGEISGFVPAKGNSSRIPNKNLSLLRGRPLFLWAAGNLARIMPKSSVFVHSDSRLILEISRRFGYSTIRRPERLCSNETTGDELMVWEAQQVSSKLVIQHFPPTPFLSTSTLEQLIGLVEEGGSMSSFGIYREQSYLWNEDGPLYAGSRLPNRIELPELIHEGMGVYVANREWLISQKKRVNGDSGQVSLDYFERIDIDYPQQLEIACLLAEGMEAVSQYVPKGVTDSKESNSMAYRPAVIFLDVDGVQTSGDIAIGPSGLSRNFNSLDGEGIKIARSLGIKIVFITAASESTSITQRAKMLSVEKVITCGRDDKFEMCSNYLDSIEVDWENCWYAGDDVPDIAPMLASGMSFAPKNGTTRVKSVADRVSDKRGGEGFVREVCELAASKQSRGQ